MVAPAAEQVGYIGYMRDSPILSRVGYPCFVDAVPIKTRAPPQKPPA